MNVRLALILTLALLAIAKDGKKGRGELRDLGWKEAKDVYTVVNETNQKFFGLPVGTKLKLDRKTQLYIPPEISENFTSDDRLKLMWNNKLTRKVYCKVGPGNLTSSSFTYGYYYHNWCRNSDGENLCCSNRICDCNSIFGYNCECKTKGI